MSSTIFAPGVSQAMKEFGSSSSAVSTLLVSIYVIGLVVGPIFLVPLSEMYGRVPLTHATNVAFMVAAVVCAVSVNIPMLLIFRLVMGATTISLGGGYVADLMSPEQRGRAMNVWIIGPVLVRLLPSLEPSELMHQAGPNDWAHPGGHPGFSVALDLWHRRHYREYNPEDAWHCGC